MQFLKRLFKSNSENKDIQSVNTEIEVLRRRIDLLNQIINDYRSNPAKYQRAIPESCADAYQQLVIDKTKLEMQYLFLTRFY